MIKNILWKSHLFFQLSKFSTNLSTNTQSLPNLQYPYIPEAQHITEFLKKKNKQQKKVQKVKVTQVKYQYNPWQAIRLMKAYSHVAFDQSIDISIKLNINPRNGEQIVRGNAIMPAGTGKKIIVAVYCPQQFKQICKAAGADIIDDQKIIQQIKQNKINFDKLYTTPDLLNDLKPFAKNLGPKGLMPNLKVGTLVVKQKLKQAIQQAKAGQVTFKVDSSKYIKCMIGKLSFSQSQILSNLESIMKVIADKRPVSVKGKYLLNASIKTTMGKSFKLDIESIDPKSKRYLLSIKQ